MSRDRLRFLFIQPEYPEQYVFFFPVYEPLHGLLLGAIVRDLAETRIFDRRFETDAALVRLIRDYRPDIVGITTHVAGEIFNVKRLLDLVKRECPETTTIVGGQHSTLLPEDLFDPSVDLICIGPGEETFREVVETLASKGSGADFTGVPGLAVRMGRASEPAAGPGNIRVDGQTYRLTAPRRPSASQLFDWPRFDRSLLDRYRRRYRFYFEFRPTIYTITTSGCPYRCSFCSLWAAARGVYRRRKPEDVVDDIVSQSPKYVHLTDDNTFHNADHAMEIFRLMKKKGLRKKVLAYARTDTIVKRSDVIEKWKEVGLGALVVGMEAVSDRHLNSVNKKTNLEINIEAQKVLDRLGIENWAHFVLLPEYDREDFEEIWSFVDRLNVCYPIFVPLTPVPGTPMFFEKKNAGELTTFDYGYCTLQYMTLRTTKMDKRAWYDELLKLYARTCSASTVWRRRRSPQFHWRPMVGRAVIFNRCMRRITHYYDRQIEHERTVRYDEIESTLPPSLRRDYRPVNYYNAPTLAAVDAALAASPVAGGD